MLTADPDFKGYIHDVGGPTANFRHPACRKAAETRRMHKPGMSVSPRVRKHASVDHSGIYRYSAGSCGTLPGVKKVFIRSGIRFDYLLADPKTTIFIRELCASPRQRNAQRWRRSISPTAVLLPHAQAGAPRSSRRSAGKYEADKPRIDKKQYLIPYFISSHPGSTLEDAVELSLAS